jgi:hypothetical protein
MSREQTLARFYFACLAIFVIFYMAGWRMAGLGRFTVALLASSIIWALGSLSIAIMFKRRSKKEVVDDERDRLISLKTTIVGGAAGYMALFLGIVFVHQRFVMNGVFTMPVDTMYQLFAVVILVFATVRELAILITYASGSREPLR